MVRRSNDWLYEAKVASDCIDKLSAGFAKIVWPWSS